MLHEYAVEPTAVGQSYKDARYLLSLFGVDRGRYISRFPKSWLASAYEASNEFSDLDKKRLTESLARIKRTALFSRERPYDPGRNWLSNAQSENARLPFHVIIAREAPAGVANIVLSEDLTEAVAAIAAPRTVTVPRTALAIAGALSPIALLGNEILLIDPFFDLQHARFRNTLSAFLAALHTAGRTSLTAQIHFRAHADRGTRTFVKGSLPNWLRGKLPAGFFVELYEWNERVGGEDLHDRFLICEFGGISIGCGFEEAGPNETANLGLLETAHAAQIRTSFARATAAFDLVSPVLRIDHNGVVTEV